MSVALILIQEVLCTTNRDYYRAQPLVKLKRIQDCGDVQPQLIHLQCISPGHHLPHVL